MSRNVQKILVATTLGESSDNVVAAGYDLCRITGAELHLLHAYMMPAMYYGSPMGMATVYPYAIEGERERVEQLLEAQLGRLDIPGEAVTGKIFEIGTAHRLLASASKELEADLILVGASDEDGAFSPLLGSTADRVLRQAHVPVWVVRGRPELPPRRVVAPIDLSDLSDESLRHGLALLDDLGDEHPALETLFVLSNIERVGSVQFTPEQVERFARQELDRMNKALEDETGWTVTAAVRTGLPRQEIKAELEKNPADLVIVGTHGRSGFERLLMGSVAADVIRHVPCSVLVVPPEEAREEAVEQKATEESAVV